ncbi:MAG: ABC transporter substrate-binding protein, partial [Acetobacteraceae bacterium]
SLERVTGWTMAESCAALRRGEVDAVQVFEPFVSSLVADGTGHVWYAAATRGPTCYTTFYTRRCLLTSRRPELHRVVRALYRTQQWIAAATAEEIGDTIAGFFPDVPAAILAASCQRYAGLGIWGRDPFLPRAGYDRLCAGLVSGGLVDTGVGFEIAVDNSIAEAVIAERPPPLA